MDPKEKKYMSMHPPITPLPIPGSLNPVKFEFVEPIKNDHGRVYLLGDTVPTENSVRIVNSGVVYTALAAKLDAPSTEGTEGQVLAMGQSGAPVWSAVSHFYGYATKSGFPDAGATGCLYIDLSTDQLYRWSEENTAYEEVAGGDGGFADWLSKNTDSNGRILSANLDVTVVEAEEGKGLSTNDYTDADQTKLAGIAKGATNVTETTVTNWGFTKNTGTYSKPTDGIPKTDLASAVQTSLGKADNALQPASGKGLATITKGEGTTADTISVTDKDGTTLDTSVPKQDTSLAISGAYADANTVGINLAALYDKAVSEVIERCNVCVATAGDAKAEILYIDDKTDPFRVVFSYNGVSVDLIRNTGVSYCTDYVAYIGEGGKRGYAEVEIFKDGTIKLSENLRGLAPVECTSQDTSIRIHVATGNSAKAAALTSTAQSGIASTASGGSVTDLSNLFSTSNTSLTDAVHEDIGYAAWAEGTTYAKGAVVLYNHKLYQSNADSNKGNTPSDTSTFWTATDLSSLVPNKDTSLAVSGAYADAKVTGEKLALRATVSSLGGGVFRIADEAVDTTTTEVLY